MTKSHLLISFMILFIFSIVLNTKVYANVSTPSDWAKETVTEYISYGLVDPDFQNNYQDNITRQEFAMLIVKAYERATNSKIILYSSGYQFTDKCDPLYKDYIQKAYQIGVISGYDNDTFGAYDPITREQMACILVRFLKLLYPNDNYDVSKNVSFADENEISDWAMNSIIYAYDNGIIQGTGNNLLSPKGFATKEQAIVMLYRLLKSKSIINESNISIKSLDDIYVTVTQGENYAPPNTVKAVMSDGSIQMVKVTWNSTNISTQNVGTFIYIGTVSGYSRNVILNLTVTANENILTVKDIAKKSNAVVLIETYDSAMQPLAQGSGFLVSSDGKVVTNFHVIKDAQYAKAFLEDGNVYDVESVINYSESQDIAVLKLKGASGLSYLEFGDSDKVERGDDVVAIGSPNGMENTISTGIISGLNRASNIRSGYDLQTTAPITHGSSGGPLFNMMGQVIGVIYSGAEAGDIEFAIPINEVKPYLNGGNPKLLSEVNRKMTYEEFSKYLQKKYPGYVLNNQTVLFNNFSLVEKDNELIVFINMYGEDNYFNYVRSLLPDTNISISDYAKNRLYVEEIMREIYDETAKEYPDKTVIGGVFAYFSLNYYPGNLYYKVNYNANTNAWDVTEWILAFYYQNGFTVQWMPYKTMN
ncbi:trypsin-like peptidase domain-containing protein [Thermoanaerobacterium thermosaccharolyticum]|uniref:trypsin-like peptidase domain-containing protein n=1 Tax=Thermoanaerobacterium thermosaccharolyticum TaxID=1517 RepID=UPI003DA9F49D